MRSFKIGDLVKPIVEETRGADYTDLITARVIDNGTTGEYGMQIETVKGTMYWDGAVRTTLYVHCYDFALKNIGETYPIF